MPGFNLDSMIAGWLAGARAAVSPSAALAQPSSPATPKENEMTPCAVCGLPLDAVAVALGRTVHQQCESARPVLPPLTVRGASRAPFTGRPNVRARETAPLSRRSRR